MVDEDKKGDDDWPETFWEALHYYGILDGASSLITTSAVTLVAFALTF